MLDKMIRDVFTLAGIYFQGHPQATKRPSVKELPNTLIFRIALCDYLLMLSWISEGSPQFIKSKKMLNDAVDVNFAALATFFDGILSLDKKLNRIYARASYFLKGISATPTIKPT